jgi:2-methylcitrate dehydratase PrpD
LLRGVSCAMSVTFRDGSTARSVVDYPKGSVQNPMSDAEISAKFELLAGDLLIGGAAERIQETIRALDTVEDVNELTGLIEAADQ